MTEASIPASKTTSSTILKQTFAALKYPNYRLWFCGQLVSVFGSWMQLAAQGYLVFEMTESQAFLGYVSFANGLPSLLMLYAGVVADRFSRRAIVVIAQTSMMILAFILATLTFLGLIQPWHILLLAFGLGVANAFDAPARLALAPELIDREDLTNAIALNATMFNLAAIFGPAAGGIIYAATGPGWCFTLNGISFIAVIGALLLMKLPALPPVLDRESGPGRIREGIRYAFSHPNIKILVCTAGIAGLLGLSLGTLLPAWAVNVLNGDAVTNGLLTSARGMGSVIGALLLASLSHYRGRGKLLTIGTFIFPAALMAFAFMRQLPLAMVMLALLGLSTVLVLNVANALVQSLVSEEVRGRVSSIYSMTFFASMPIGSLLLGWLAEAIGEQTAVILNALICLAIAVLVLLFVPRLRELE
ncbi:MAG: MFS transporter [Anaerolineae bacterium]|nr:MFS transporter [Anaerolineae bacterium]